MLNVRMAIPPTEILWQIEELRRLVAASFPVDDVWFDGDRPAFVIRRPADVRAGFAALRRRLEPLRLMPALRRRRGADIVILVPAPPPVRTRWEVNLLLFVATLATTSLGGYTIAQGLVRDGLMQSTIGGALAFSLPLMTILLTHEMGHKIASAVRGIQASLPYFIPFVPLPPLWGTMGAVIVTRSPAPDRDSLMDLGASGPLAGFVVTIPFLIYGLQHSFIVQPLAEYSSFPDPLLVRWLTSLLLHPPEGTVILGHPTYWAAWLGLLVTSLNLLPASMLDGGHMLRALLGPERHRVISYVSAVVAVGLGFVFMGILILAFTARGHPGPLDDLTPVNGARRLVAVLLLIILVASIVPIWGLRL